MSKNTQSNIDLSKLFNKYIEDNELNINIDVNDVSKIIWSTLDKSTQRQVGGKKHFIASITPFVDNYNDSLDKKTNSSSNDDFVKNIEELDDEDIKTEKPRKNKKLTEKPIKESNKNIKIFKINDYNVEPFVHDESFELELETLEPNMNLLHKFFDMIIENYENDSNENKNKINSKFNKFNIKDINNTFDIAFNSYMDMVSKYRKIANDTEGTLKLTSKNIKITYSKNKAKDNIESDSEENTVILDFIKLCKDINKLIPTSFKDNEFKYLNSDIIKTINILKNKTKAENWERCIPEINFAIKDIDNIDDIETSNNEHGVLNYYNIMNNINKNNNEIIYNNRIGILNHPKFNKEMKNILWTYAYENMISAKKSNINNAWINILSSKYAQMIIMDCCKATKLFTKELLRLVKLSKELLNNELYPISFIFTVNMFGYNNINKAKTLNSVINNINEMKELVDYNNFNLLYYLDKDYKNEMMKLIYK